MMIEDTTRASATRNKMRIWIASLEKPPRINLHEVQLKKSGIAMGKKCAKKKTGKVSMDVYGNGGHCAENGAGPGDTA